MIFKHAKKLYGAPETFEDFVYYSQLTQAMAVSMAVAGHRIDAPRCGGTLYWQINDCWPAPSWSSLDYFGNWKALQYRIKDDYEEVAVVAKYNNLEDIDYYLVSGVEDTFDCTVFCKIVNLKGDVVSEEVFDIAVNGQNSFQLEIEKIKNKCRDKNFHLMFNWKDNLGNEQKRSFDHLPKDYKRATEDEVTVVFESVDSEAGTAVAVVTNKKFIQDAWLIVDQAGVKFSENFVSYLPGTHKIKVEFQKGTPLNTIEIKWL
jgi:beta-mannosidase